MLNRYYQKELAYLRELGADFSKRHPAIAPMLSGPTTDPDVERLLEGVAFLTGLLKMKQEDEFPEIIHGLMRLIMPHYLRPLPSTTIVVFKPKPMMKTTLRIPAGVELASRPVDGTACLFRTCNDVVVHPLDIADASFMQRPGKPPEIRLVCELRNQMLADWQPGALRFFLGGGFTNATQIYYLLQHGLRRIEIRSLDTENSCYLSPDHLKPVGFDSDFALLPYPDNAFPAYRVLQEYFMLPEKFLFLELGGWENWQERGNGATFEIRFEVETEDMDPPRITPGHFILNAVPAVNLFSHDADPIRLDHKKAEYHLRPSGKNTDHYQIYNIRKVSGFVQGTAEVREYTPFDALAAGDQSEYIYYQSVRRSLTHDGLDMFLSVAYPRQDVMPTAETLSAQLECTNGMLAEAVQVGDICEATSSSPEFVDFENIRPPTVNVLPPLGSDLLWRLLSHLSLNYASLESAENLKAILKLYVFEESRDRSAVLANLKRLDGILKVTGRPVDRLFSSVMMRGREIRLEMSSDHFAGKGDLYLFGCILDYFLGVYASVNAFMHLRMRDMIKGDEYQWPVRSGEHMLL